MYICGLVFDLS